MSGLLSVTMMIGLCSFLARVKALSSTVMGVDVRIRVDAWLGEANRAQ